MEAEREAMEAAKKETITEDGTIIEIPKGFHSEAKSGHGSIQAR